MSATLDYYLRAYDTRTGHKLWRRAAGRGQATPMSYVSDKTGRQYVVVMAGGHGLARHERWAIHSWRTRCRTTLRLLADSGEGQVRWRRRTPLAHRAARDSAPSLRSRQQRMRRWPGKSKGFCEPDLD